MKVLLDTHIAVWVVTDNARLKSSARKVIQSADAVWVSSATIWEIAIKFALGRARLDDMPFPGSQARTHFLDAGMRFLDIDAGHAAAVDGLPPIHGDPFDRLLVVQSRVEGMTLLTDDDRLTAYGSHVMAL